MVADLADAAVRAANAQSLAVAASQELERKFTFFAEHVADVVDAIGPEAFNERFSELLPSHGLFVPVNQRINAIVDKYNKFKKEQVERPSTKPMSKGKTPSPGEARSLTSSFFLILILFCLAKAAKVVDPKSDGGRGAASSSA